MKTSILVATYNWPDAFRLCLKSILSQRVLPDEIVIADDGSTAETSDVIRDITISSPVPVIHVWQEDDGFRLAQIRNKAIARCSGDYIIQIDGDLILHRDFVGDHIRFARRASFVSGSRVNLDQQLSSRLLGERSTTVSVFSKGTKNFLNGLHLPFLSAVYENHKKDDVFRLRGCNMAFWKEDLIAVNGYNEAMTGWGREDSELAVRLCNTGIEKRLIKFSAIVFHLYHHERSRESLNVNDSILQESICEKKSRCNQGLDAYLGTSGKRISDEFSV